MAHRSVVVDAERERRARPNDFLATPALRTSLTMRRRAPLAPLPEPLARAMAALRSVRPPPGIEGRLRIRLVRTPDEPARRRKRRLLVIGSVVLALAMEVSPFLANAQDAARDVPASRDGAAEHSRPQTVASSEESARLGTAASAQDAHAAPVTSSADAPAARSGTSAAVAPAQVADVASSEESQSREDEDFRFSASLLDGLRFEAPRAAALTIELHAYLWLRAQIDHDHDQTADFFSVPLARFALIGSAFDGLVRFFVQPEFAGTPQLLDAQVELALDPALVVRVGQFRTPFSRSFITGLMVLDFPDRGLVANTFNAGRDTGLMLYGRPFGGALEYYAGVFNGSGINGRIGDTPMPMLMGRIAVTPLGSVPYDQTPSLTIDVPAGIMIGADGYYRVRQQDGMPNLEEETASASTDLAVAFGPFSLQSEGFLRWRRTGPEPWTMAWAVYAQAGIFVFPRVLELAARGSWIDPSTDAGGNFVQAYEAAVNAYFALDGVSYGQHLKLVVAYRFADARAPFGDVPMGRSHRVTAQAQLFF